MWKSVRDPRPRFSMLVQSAALHGAVVRAAWGLASVAHVILLAL